MTTPLALWFAGPALFSTRRHAFLTQMQQWLPWAELVAQVAPYHDVVESGRGRPRVDLELRLRLYCLQQWYDLADPATEEEVTDSLSLRHCAGLSLAARVPDETTLCTCRHLLAAHALGTRIFALIQQHLAGLGFRLREVAPHVTPRIPNKRPRGGVLSGRQRAAQRIRAHHRARVEHPFRVLKGIFGFRKVRYRGWHQHTQRCFVLCALAHLYLVRPQRTAQAAAGA